MTKAEKIADAKLRLRQLKLDFEMDMMNQRNGITTMLLIRAFENVIKTLEQE